MIYIEVSGCLPMCGHGTIGVATVLVETGMVEVTEPETVIRLDVPAGLVEARVAVENGRARSVTIRNVPSFLHARDRTVDVPGLGEITYDMAYGGNFYALTPAADAGLVVDPARSRRADRGRAWRRWRRSTRTDRPVHPEDPRIGGCRHVVFHEPGRDGADAVAATSIHPGWLDRSPCGTGTSARLAQLHARGELAIGEPFVNESVIGTRFTGRVVEETTVAGARDHPGDHRPRLDHRAWASTCWTPRIRSRPGFASVMPRRPRWRYAPRGMPARDDEVQALVEQLSAELDRSVLVDDASLRLLAYSPTLGSEDEVRRTAILTRETPRVIRDLHFAQGIATATQPVRTAPRPDIGLESRVCVPIRCQGALFGYLWLIDADQSLTDADCDAAERTRGRDRHRDVPPRRAREARSASTSCGCWRQLLGADAGAARARPRRSSRRTSCWSPAPGSPCSRCARGATREHGARRRPSAPGSASRWTSSAARCRAASRSASCTATTA